MMAKQRVLGNICCHIKVFTVLNKQERQGIPEALTGISEV